MTQIEGRRSTVALLVGAMRDLGAIYTRFGGAPFSHSGAASAINRSGRGQGEELRLEFLLLERYGMIARQCSRIYMITERGMRAGYLFARPVPTPTTDRTATAICAHTV